MTRSVTKSKSVGGTAVDANMYNIVAKGILDTAAYLGIRRMPTYSEILRYYGKSTLNVKIAATGGTEAWAVRLSLPLTDPDEVGICEICGKSFKRLKPQERYCSIECRKEAFRRSSYAEIICPVCGKKFVKSSKNQKYCCPEHAAQRREERKTEKRKAESSRNVSKNNGLCRRKQSCKYGAQLAGFWYCDYLSMTGKSRSKKGRECEHYEKRVGEYRKRYDLW